MAVNLAAPRSFLLPFSPLSSSSSTVVQIQHNPSCSLRNWLKFSSRVLLKKSISVVSAASTAVVSTGKEEYLPPLEVSEIDGKCKRWVWKGYSINYFVYPEGNGDAATTNPPLLLVHGFGASIAHWRRSLSLSLSVCARKFFLLGLCNYYVPI